ncbi:hypothetical protein NEOLEDRAFT_1181654 [Neolentinus lepideus HHB14362 ss-1]|uniref:Uncharacterized protein n=1 Tax=Neolentinus lepideus HHB14362 ss-1 TaxID=1314782 RepID=A0A165PTG1_9AGAM|nr:hypothetical protein NEOLEDRAFT_1181654 [Neolentinus lepideus HHB14362 ss-1]
MSFCVDPSTTFVDQTLVSDIQAPIFSTHVDCADAGAAPSVHIDLAAFNTSAKVNSMSHLTTNGASENVSFPAPSLRDEVFLPSTFTGGYWRSHEVGVCVDGTERSLEDLAAVASLGDQPDVAVFGDARRNGPMSCSAPVDQLQQLEQDFRAQPAINGCAPLGPDAADASAPPSTPLLAMKALPAEDVVDDHPSFVDDSQSSTWLSFEHADVDLELPALLDSCDVPFNSPSPSYNIGLFDFDYPPSPSTASATSSFDSPPPTPLLSSLDISCLECSQYAQDGHAVCGTCGFTALLGMEGGCGGSGVRVVNAGEDLMDGVEDSRGGCCDVIPGLQHTWTSKIPLDGGYKFGQLPPQAFEQDEVNTLGVDFSA